MIPVTTWIDTFKLPIDTSSCSIIQITYAQGNYKIVKEYKNGQVPAGMTLNGKFVVSKLNQTETKGFNDKTMAKAQIRVLTNSGDVFASMIFSFYVGETLNEEILTNG